VAGGWGVSTELDGAPVAWGKQGEGGAFGNNIPISQAGGREAAPEVLRDPARETDEARTQEAARLDDTGVPRP
jgi:hypothetical protein